MFVKAFGQYQILKALAYNVDMIALKAVASTYITLHKIMNLVDAASYDNWHEGL
jgi:hypothetical protein